MSANPVRDGEVTGRAGEQTGIAQSALRGFVSLTERKVSPKGIASLYGRAEMLSRLPLGVQRWIVSRASNDDDMGFVVDPYCFFLAYEITDIEAATRLLPPGYRIVPTAMFEDSTPRPCAIVGAFNVRASAFAGSRVELYVIAENTQTGLLTWVICDYESNTINYDPGTGFSAATTERAVITTTHTGEVLIDVRSAERPNRLRVAAPTTRGAGARLAERLWIEGNLSVDYGGRLAHAGSEPFGLIFDPEEMARATRIPLTAIEIGENTFGAAFCAAAPFEAACFPYAQHFLTATYPRATPIRDREGLRGAFRAEADAERSAGSAPDATTRDPRA